MPLILKEIREKKRISQLQLSKRAGISRSYISELEAGLYDPTKIIIKLCIALECTPNELITGWRKEK